MAINPLRIQPKHLHICRDNEIYIGKHCCYNRYNCAYSHADEGIFPRLFVMIDEYGRKYKRDRNDKIAEVANSSCAVVFEYEVQHVFQQLKDIPVPDNAY